MVFGVFHGARCSVYSVTLPLNDRLRGDMRLINRTNAICRLGRINIACLRNDCKIYANNGRAVAV